MAHCGMRQDGDDKYFKDTITGSNVIFKFFWQLMTNKSSEYMLLKGVCL
jgi:hypothetical protein